MAKQRSNVGTKRSTSVSLDETQSEAFEQLSSEFNSLATGLNSIDFEKHLAIMASTTDETEMSMKNLNKIIKDQAKTNSRTLKRDKKRLQNLGDELRWWGKMNPLKNKDYKMMKNKVGLEEKNLSNLKRYNTAMGAFLGGMKKGVGAAAGGVGKLVGKLGLLGGGVMIVKKLADEFLKVNKFIADVSKQFGISSKAATAYTKVLAGAEDNTAKFLINMEQLHETASELALQLGGINNLTSEAVEVTAKMQKAFGMTAKDASDLFTSMTLGMGMTADEAERAAEHMRSFAQENGAVASLVLRDLASSSALVAMSMGRSTEDVTAMAIKAQKLGTTFNAMEESNKRFILNFEGSADAIAEINNRLGTSMRSDIMAINAETGNWAENQDMILTAVERYEESGIRSISTEQALENLGGQRMDELIKMTRLRKEGNLDLDKEYAKRRKLDEVIRSGMDIWEKIKGIIMGQLQPAFTYIGRMLNDKIDPIMESITAYASEWGDKLSAAMSGTESFGTKMSKVIMVLAQPLKDLFVGAVEAALDALAKRSTVMSWLVGGDNTERQVAMQEQAAGVATGMGGEWKPPPGTKDGDAMGNVYSSPHMALVGEEGRSEVIIPTERIRNGMPVSKSVADELSSIGVPGYGIGRGRQTSASALSSQIQTSSAANAQYSAAGDPASMRRRTRDFETAANAHREELRRMHRTEHQQQLAVLDAEEANTRAFGAYIGVSTGGGRSQRGGFNIQSMMPALVMGVEKLYDRYADRIPQRWKDVVVSMSKIAQTGMRIYQEGRAYYQAFQQNGVRGVVQRGLQTGHIAQAGVGLANRMANTTRMDAETYEAMGGDAVMGVGGNIKARGGRMGAIGSAMQSPVGQAAGQAGLAGLQAFAGGASVKDSVLAGGDSLAAMGMQSGNPYAMAAAAVWTVGRMLIGRPKSKKKSRKAAMKGLTEALGGRGLSSYGKKKDLQRAMGDGPGSSSYDKTIQAMDRVTGGKLGYDALGGLAAVLIGKGMTASEREGWIEHFEDQLGYKSPTAEAQDAFTAANASPAGRQATGAMPNYGGGGSYGGGGGGRSDFGGGGGDSVNGGQAGSDMVYELRALRRELAEKNGEIRIDMDGREVARVVTSNQEDMALGT
jgi:hypothetical protein